MCRDMDTSNCLGNGEVQTCKSKFIATKPGILESPLLVCLQNGKGHSLVAHSVSSTDGNSLQCSSDVAASSNCRENSDDNELSGRKTKLHSDLHVTNKMSSRERKFSTTTESPTRSLLTLSPSSYMRKNVTDSQFSNILLTTHNNIEHKHESKQARMSLSQLLSAPLQPHVHQAEDANSSADFHHTASITDVSAFLNMTTDQTAAITDADSGLRLIESINGNGILNLVESDGRIYCITSDADANTSITMLTSASNNIETFSLVNDQTHMSTQSCNPDIQVMNESVNSRKIVSKNKAKKQKKSKSSGLAQLRQKGGWPKGKRRKTVEFRIKAPASAYLIFAKKRRKEIMAEFPYYTFSEVTKIMGKEWTEMDYDLKDAYNKRADEDKQRFKDELKSYQQSEEYQNILKRKRDERKRNGNCGAEEDIMDEEMMLYCRICDQRFSSSHNRAEHLAGRVHLNNLHAELRKENKQNTTNESCLKHKNEVADKCCRHCVKRLPNTVSDLTLDCNSLMESLMYKHVQREIEIQSLRENLLVLKEANSHLSKELISVQDMQEKLKQDIQQMRDLSLHFTQCIDNLKMVPTLFGVINF